MKNKDSNFIINRLPPESIEGQCIVLLSSYRTGSTALCRLLATCFKLPNLDELFHWNNDPAIYGDYKKQPCVVKIQPDQIVQPYWNDLTSNAYIIGLTRRSLMDQIASFYCCHATGIWHSYAGHSRQEYKIEWTKHDLEDQCRYIIKMNKTYQDLRHICAQEFLYEDICDELQDSGMERMIPPSNYAQLLEDIADCLTSLEHHDN
jgi:LPS sulfotransferase NodH